MVAVYFAKELKSSSGKRQHCRKIQIDTFLSPCKKLKSKWIKNLHIKQHTLKLIEDKLGKSLKHVGTGEIFLDRTPMAYVLRSRINKWDLIKLKSFCKAQDTVNRTKKIQPTDWKKIVTNCTSNRCMQAGTMTLEIILVVAQKFGASPT